MSLFYRLVLNSICRSNHHRLAIAALKHLKSKDAETWRDLFLHHHQAYLEGAKAPDDVFKDFKNHVLHPRDGDWGGAPMAAREWYRRAVRALAQKDWRQAVYCAGVMSHYVVDPIQPLHTGQTEEENVIHRAVEWSFSKNYDELQRILEQDLGGYTEVAISPGGDWLEQTIRAGARLANQNYEKVVDHFDFAAAVKRPEAGLDQELKDLTAKLIGHATILLARVLERAFAEAAVGPPKVSLALDTLLAVMKLPLNAVLKRIADAGERMMVARQYEEFCKTGKLRTTLSEDDRIVRELHATEVLKKPISTLDAQWPRETGTAHGTGTPARSRKKVRAEKPKPRAKSAPAAKAKAAPPPPPAKQPTAAPTRPAQGGRARLSYDAPVEDAPSIGTKTASRLAAAGIRTVKDLLAASPDGAADKIKFRHISASVIRDWQAQAELACTVPNLTSLAAQLVVAAGVRDAADLAAADAEMLANIIEEFCETPDGQRTLRDANPPTRDDIERWITAAKGATAKQAA
jgi:predicted flap endonuclease-1-like 5' DNA nuclease